MKKVISFSIYGDNPKYTVGLLKNIELSEKIYPDWKVFIYYNNTVPVDMIEKYQSFDNCEIFNMDDYNISGMLWRFFPNDGVERFISRDADSRLSEREKYAVDKWIESGKSLHIMRDHPHHTSNIFGGMFGLVIHDDLNLKNEIIKWSLDKKLSLFNKWDDVNFLYVIYEKYKNMNDIISHDSCFKHFPFSIPFPTPMENFNFVGEIFDENDTRYYQYQEWINKKEIRE